MSGPMEKGLKALKAHWVNNPDVIIQVAKALRACTEMTEAEYKAVLERAGANGRAVLKIALEYQLEEEQDADRRKLLEIALGRVRAYGK